MTAAEPITEMDRPLTFEASSMTPALDETVPELSPAITAPPIKIDEAEMLGEFIK